MILKNNLHHFSDSPPSETNLSDEEYRVSDQPAIPSATNISNLPGFESLFKNVRGAIMENQINCGDFQIDVRNPNRIKFYKFSDNSGIDIERAVLLLDDSLVKVFIHGVELPRTSKFVAIANNCTKLSEFEMLLKNILESKVCKGNCESELTDLVPQHKGISFKSGTKIDCYKEIGFVKNDNNVFCSSIRSTDCTFLIDESRCYSCRKVRRNLLFRLQEKSTNASPKDLTADRKPNSFLSSPEKDLKLKQYALKTRKLNAKIYALEEKVEKLKRKCNELISKSGENFNEIENVDIENLLESCKSDVEKQFEENSFQRIFFEQQIKYNKLKNKSSMCWHPSMIRFCLYIKHKSTKAYDSLRYFINLPSSRTLYDYSHFNTKLIGYSENVIEQLIYLCEKNEMYYSHHKSFVGILQDEIKIKSDLVYNKHSGELIGFVNLENVSNELLELEKDNGSNKIAEYLLVLMVRGISTNLKYPLAAFASNGITSDFLYPIIWEGISILEIHVGINVLFICCDGASPNRKFFALHGPKNSLTYKTRNPFDANRYIYFISDVPHLLKTARNCFSNSYSHLRSRMLWNKKPISWMHIVQLFEQFCEFSCFSPVPKLTRKHIDLSSFSLMNVSLAAQVMSNHVSKALEMYIGDTVSETAIFVKIMNDWFDIMNTKSFEEAKHARNSNLSPFRSINDVRLNWLRGVFLPYFDQWKSNVETRYGMFTEKQKSGMQLSHQTLKGLRITTWSITECIEFMLNHGADFVLTSHFNQDPLEQIFGHLRHKCGSNVNPTVNEAIHSLNTIRVVNTQAMAPKRGNTKVDDQFQLDETPLKEKI